MNIQWNPGWRVFEKGIFIYQHYYSKFTNIKKKWDSGTGTTLTGTGTTYVKRGSGHSVPVLH